MEDGEYFKPKHRKLDKHFDILVNGTHVKILKYKIYNKWNCLDKKEYQVIELISKISNQNLNFMKVNITIERDNNLIDIIGIFHGRFSQPGLDRYMFKIEKMIEK